MAYHPIVSRPFEYDPYAYPSVFYSPPCDDGDLTCTARPVSTHRRPRAASIWSTSSVCSDDSSVSVVLDDRAHDFDDEPVISPISPAESSSSRTSWSSVASSSSAATSSSATLNVGPERYRRASTGKPRGPRPLPALPSSQPPSPYYAPSALPPVVSLKATPPLRLNTKFFTPPPSYEEAISAIIPTPNSKQSPQSHHELRPTSVSEQFPFDAETDAANDAEFLTSPSEETIIDWQRIEEYMAADCDG